MGRMFRIITETVPEPRRTAEVAETATLEPETPEIPFVEVGGPQGLIGSYTPPPLRIEPVPAPRPAPEPPAPEPLPRIIPAESSRVLSVAFHRFPKAGLRLLPSGVSSDVVAYHDPEHPITQEYRLVRDEIRQQFEEEGARVVVFSAGAPVAGTTTVMLNLAVELTRVGAARVLVVDANLARPAISRRLGVADTPGLADVLGQTVPLAWALQPTAIPNLQVLAAGIIMPGIGHAMANDFPRLLVQLRQWFDWVLVDAGVWGEAAGRDGIGPACDAVYLVTRQHDIDRPEFAGLRASVTGTGGLLRGYITTRS